MNPTQPTPEQLPANQVPEVPAAPMPEAPASGSFSASPVAPLPVTPTDPPSVAPPAAAPAPIQGATPTVAEDVDVIEKAWVDQADAEVKRTEGDPHAEEEAIEDLQVDYLDKRYDHKVNKPTE